MSVSPLSPLSLFITSPTGRSQFIPFQRELHVFSHNVGECDMYVCVCV